MPSRINRLAGGAVVFSSQPVDRLQDAAKGYMPKNIQLTFRRFDAVKVHEIIDQLGVYVFWSGSAVRKPSYIGEGDFLSRLTSHKGKEWARRPLDGYVALVDYGTDRENKRAVEFGEMALLDCSREIDAWPTHNGPHGKQRGLDDIRRRAGPGHHTFNVTVSGRDPFSPPERSSDVRKVISYQPDGDDYTITCPWNRRR